MMKAVDLTEDAKRQTFDPNDHWSDYVDWKGYRAAGYEAVVLDGSAFMMGKHGLGDPVPMDQVEVVAEDEAA